jgi:site-specific recombinase XerC
MRWRDSGPVFRTSRDLAIVGLMLLQGLRSQEVLDLNRDDLLLPEAQIRVRGKGNKTASCRWLLKRLSCSITICGWSGPQTLYSFL